MEGQRGAGPQGGCGMAQGPRLSGPLQGCEGPLGCVMCSRGKGGGLVPQQLKEMRYFLTRSPGLLARW